MLRQLPVDTIKIDRSFVSRLDRPACHADSVLVGAVIDTAHAFGLKVVAEGVERPTQIIALADMGSTSSRDSCSVARNPRDLTRVRAVRATRGW